VDANTDKLPWPDNYFDSLTAWCLVAHLENPHHFIREAHRVLKPGGLFLNYMPHIGSLYAKKIYFKTGDFVRYVEGFNHISIFTPAVYKTTVLKYFNEEVIEYGVDSKIYTNRLGLLKRIGVEKDWPHFKRWFATSIIWILTKK
jgi:ubiquinone/menaquinone biosynthesis C-methylase UbiE